MLSAAMRTLYLMDDVRRRAGEAVRRILAAEHTARQVRRRRAWLGLALAAGVAGAGWVLWRAGSAPPQERAPAAQASVPAHQQSGPLANPWGSGAPVLGEAPSRAAAAVGASGVSAVASGAGRDGASGAAPKADVSLAGDAAREAVRAAVGQWRVSARAADFVAKAMQSGEPAQLAVAWMAERQCRQVAQWRLMFEWRARAVKPGARADTTSVVPVSGVHPQLRSLLGRCVDMPEDSAFDAALAAAGFAATSDLPESTRRPLDLARAAALGDPTLLASVVDASTAEDLLEWVVARTSRRGASAPETSIEVAKAALWLASCRAAAGGGGAAAAAQGAAPTAKSASCHDHPALWQACTQQGLCDARDLHDLILRTMPADQWHASQRLAQWLAPEIGR
jgi:hypothetical protein